MGRGLRATRPLADGDPVLTVPLALCISRDLVHAGPADDLAAAGGGDGDGGGGGGGGGGDELAADAARARARSSRSSAVEDLISLFVLREKALGARSLWAPYLATLPAHVPQLALFGEQALEGLHDARMVAQAKLARGRLEGAYDKARPRSARSSRAPRARGRARRRRGRRRGRARARDALGSYGVFSPRRARRATRDARRATRARARVARRRARRATRVARRVADEERTSGPRASSPRARRQVRRLRVGAVAVSSRALTFRGVRLRSRPATSTSARRG